MALTTGVSADEFLGGDWDRDAELVDGEVVVNDPTLWHQRIAGRVFRRLEEWSEQAGRGMAGFGGNWTLAPGNVYKPDVWWVADADRLDLRASSTDGSPDLTVEVRSPGTWHLDIGRKRAAYETAGVAELWLVDWPAATVLVHRRCVAGAPTFDGSAEVGPGEVLTSPLLDGFALSIDELFA
ncbi:MAG: Uma2 family endonuclease, partial [Acidimicrobiales bacterium]